MCPANYHLDRGLLDKLKKKTKKKTKKMCPANYHLDRGLLDTLRCSSVSSVIGDCSLFFFFCQNKSIIFEDKEMSQSLSMIVSFENATCVGNIALDSWPHNGLD